MNIQLPGEEIVWNLHESSFHLTDVNCWVQRLAKVHHDVSSGEFQSVILIFIWSIKTPEDMMVSCQTVNLNRGASNPIGEVVEGVAGVCLEVVADVRSGVEPGRWEAHPGNIGFELWIV